MKLIVMLMLALLSIPTASWAGTVRMRCPLSHFQRSLRTEMRSAAIGFNNGDPVNAATIERLTIYDFFGIVVHDSGPAIGVPHPLNRDVRTSGAPDGWDITTVPPNANYYIRTNHIWGNNPIPDQSDGISGNRRGQFMSVIVEFSKRGKRRLFVLTTRDRARELEELNPGPPPVFRERAERSSTPKTCFRVPRRDKGDDDDNDDDDDDDDD